ncbi:imidazolonepropionase-like domain-containing protein [Streptomyces sp. NPDC052415]|uniref:imidazolonepropionase-like domain-containing protein n=1 Tax=Streptomyces sp. NPDC052415 TaxID=3365690 RepID=UPI0037D73D11
MLTIHAAPLVVPLGAEPVPDGAVAVDGERVAAIGPYAELAASFDGARTRRWPGVLTPGLRQWHGRWLLTRCYHPDPREADELGTAPITGAALGELAPDAARMAGSVRRGLQRMLAHGTTHVGGPFPDAVRQSVVRAGLREVPEPWRSAPPAWDGPDLDPFVEGYDLPGTAHGPLTVGGRADLAVFDVPDEAALLAEGAGTCVATVLGGRLVHRRR